MFQLTSLQRQILELLARYPVGLSLSRLRQALQANSSKDISTEIWDQLQDLIQKHRVERVPLPYSTPESPQFIYRFIFSSASSRKSGYKTRLATQLPPSASNIRNAGTPKSYVATRSHPHPAPASSQRQVAASASMTTKSVPMLRATLVDRGIHYEFLSGKFDDYAFFTFRAEGNTVKIILNQSHPIHEKLSTILRSNGHASSEFAALRELVTLLLISWVEYESSRVSAKLRRRTEDMRAEWGRTLKKLLCDGEDCE